MAKGLIDLLADAISDLYWTDERLDILIEVNLIIDTFDYIFNGIGFSGAEHFYSVQWLRKLPFCIKVIIIDCSENTIMNAFDYCIFAALIVVALD